MHIVRFSIRRDKRGKQIIDFFLKVVDDLQNDGLYD